MGRHSASYIAAQHRLCTEPTAAGAATYVGRVGALALAFGIGAAVAGGAGIANAEGPADNNVGGAGAHSSPHSPTGDGKADGLATAKSPTAKSPTAKSPTVGLPGVKTRKHRLFGEPNMKLGNSDSAPTDHVDTPGAGPGSLPGWTAGIPHKIAAALVPDTKAGTSGPSTAPRAVRPTPRSISRAHGRPTAGQTQTGGAGTGEPTVESFSRGLADNAAAAIRGDLQRLSAAPSPAEDTIKRKLAPLPSTATATQMLVANFAAAIHAAPTQAKPAEAKPVLAHPVAAVFSIVSSALGFSSSASSTGGSPTTPMPMLLGVLQLVHREIETKFLHRASTIASYTSAQTYANPTIAPPVPTPADQVSTAYGDIGKWMLESNGQISDYGGQPYGGKTLLEPVNVIIVDPTSKTSWQAGRKLNTAMFWAGFPAQPIHSTGFRGIIDDTTYRQQPKGLISGYSDNFFLFPNDHGRIFGPDPVETSMGYVWSGAFSSEELGLYNGLPTHTYVSSNMARTALAWRLVASGQATYGGMVPLDNSYNTSTTTTGDHDGYAVVIVLK